MEEKPSTSEGYIRKRIKDKKVHYEENIVNDEDSADDAPLIATNVKRKKRKIFSRGISLGHCDAAPYGGKIFLARKKKPDPWWVTLIEALVVIFCIIFAIYAYFFLDNVIFHIQHSYAWLGHSHSQHIIGLRYLTGVGTKKNRTHAMKWFRHAADQDHPAAKFNLAVGHLRGYHDSLEPGEPRSLLEDAASSGVEEAHDVLKSTAIVVENVDFIRVAYVYILIVIVSSDVNM